jgi:hypothetical protein
MFTEIMKVYLKILFIITFFLSAAHGMSQVANVPDETQEVKLKKAESVTDTRTTSLADDNNQPKGADNKKGSVKRVKSARPDMSRSRGARPPDIVRPSGSRIPKGIGRPAGAIRHGRG